MAFCNANIIDDIIKTSASYLDARNLKILQEVLLTLALLGDKMKKELFFVELR